MLSVASPTALRLYDAKLPNPQGPRQDKELNFGKIVKEGGKAAQNYIKSYRCQLARVRAS